MNSPACPPLAESWRLFGAGRPEPAGEVRPAAFCPKAPTFSSVGSQAKRSRARTTAFCRGRPPVSAAPRSRTNGLRLAPTAGEALLLALHASGPQPSARTAGLLHRVRQPFIGLVTSVGARSARDRGGARAGDPPPRSSAGHGARAGGDPGPPRPPAAAERAIARRFSACGASLVRGRDGSHLRWRIPCSPCWSSAAPTTRFRSDDADVLQTIAALVGFALTPRF